jgi:zinc transporter 2
LNDAAHLAIDSSGFLLALLAYYYSELPGTKIFSYGFGRVEVFGALISILSLWFVTFLLVCSAYNKASMWFEGKAEPMNGKLTFFFGCFGVFVNIILTCVFGAEHGESSLHAHDHSHSHSHSHKYEQVKVKSYQNEDVEIEMSPIKTNEHHKEIVDSHNHSHEHHSVINDNSHNHSHEHENHDDNCCSESSPIKSSTAISSYSGHDHSIEDHHHDCSDSHNTTTTKSSMFVDANSEAAYLHVITDLIQSIGVAIAGAIIWIFPTAQIFDPLCVFLFSFLVVYTTVPLVKKILIILMDGTTEHINRVEIEKKLKSIHGVTSVHDFHVWSISSTIVCSSVHIEARDQQKTLKLAQKILKSNSLFHSTIQVSIPDDCCEENDEDNKQFSPLCVV